MKNPDKIDLRIIRTKEAIRKAFEEMICEMDYDQITIKELTKRARINRKTFYLHYSCLEDLLKELQKEMAQSFINKTKDLKRPEDMDKITREFFMVSESSGKLHEKLLCSGSYQLIGKEITDEIMSETWGVDGKRKNKNPFIQNIISTFVSQSTIEIYKQWIRDGKKIPLKDIIDLTTELVCHGLDGV